MAAGNLRREDVPEFDSCRSLLARAAGGRRVVEVRHRHAISPDDNFKMEPGYTNFQSVRRGQTLARDRQGVIVACETGLVLLPLYQTLGDDGFFLGREVKTFWLSLSAWLRRLKIGDYVHLLPGVRRDPLDENFSNCRYAHRPALASSGLPPAGFPQAPLDRSPPCWSAAALTIWKDHREWKPNRLLKMRYRSRIHTIHEITHETNTK